MFRGCAFYVLTMLFCDDKMVLPHKLILQFAREVFFIGVNTFSLCCISIVDCKLMWRKVPNGVE